MTTGMRRGLPHYGDAGLFSLFLRKAFIKAMGYSDDALGRPIAQMMAMASADVLAVVGSRQSQPAAYGRG